MLWFGMNGPDFTCSIQPDQVFVSIALAELSSHPLKMLAPRRMERPAASNRARSSPLQDCRRTPRTETVLCIGASRSNTHPRRTRGDQVEGSYLQALDWPKPLLSQRNRKNFHYCGMRFERADYRRDRKGKVSLRLDDPQAHAAGRRAVRGRQPRRDSTVCQNINPAGRRPLRRPAIRPVSEGSRQGGTEGVR